MSTERLHRCFYAIKFTPEVTSYLAGIVEELKLHGANVAWTPERNIHLTLRFLGEIDDDRFEQARRLPSGEAPFRSFTLRASGLGAFPLLRAPRVFWAGVEGEAKEDIDRLLHLQERTEQWARRIGLDPENRRYSPHITLGRVRRPPDGMKELVDDLIARECRSGLSPTTELVLIESTLGSDGSRYDVVERWGMEGAGF